jgi:hypothetical protein
MMPMTRQIPREFAGQIETMPAGLSEKRVFQKIGRICLETGGLWKTRALPP